MMSYWFIIDSKLFKLGKGKNLIIFYCSSLPLSQLYMWQCLENKELMNGIRLIAVCKFEMAFKSNGLYHFSLEDLTIHVNKNGKKINIFIMEYTTDNIQSLEDFLVNYPIKITDRFNLPIIYFWRMYIIGGYVSIFIILLIIYSYNFILPNINMDKKYELLSKIS